MAVPDVELENLHASRKHKVNFIRTKNPGEDAEEPVVIDGKSGEEIEDRVLRVIRDNIISCGKHLREVFGIKSEAIDVQLSPYYMKRKIKDTLGQDATYKEVSWFVDKLMMQNFKKILMRSVSGKELGQTGFVKSRYLSSIDSEAIVKSGNLDDQMFNFKEFESVMRTTLFKAGYK